MNSTPVLCTRVRHVMRICNHTFVERNDNFFLYGTQTFFFFLDSIYPFLPYMLAKISFSLHWRPVQRFDPQVNSSKSKNSSLQLEYTKVAPANPFDILSRHHLRLLQFHFNMLTLHIAVRRFACGNNLLDTRIHVYNVGATYNPP